MNTLPIGTLLRERYFIKGVLGSSSTGVVYLAKDQQAKDLKYQLFSLQEIDGLSQQDRYQFTFNGTSLRQLQHPALPHIYHVFNDDKRECVYLITDYVEGTNLETLRLKQPTQRLAWPELRSLCEPLVAALIYLHYQEKPLFHGDIRPTNVIQSVTGKVLFLNLGFAQAATLDGMRFYSPAPDSYRAPEQFSGQLDERTDVYGLGAMLYKLLVGQDSVDALTRLERGNKKKTSPSLIALKAAPDLPRPLVAALQKALALDPDDRFQSIREFWQALIAVPVADQDATLSASPQQTPIPLPASLAASPARQNRPRRVLLPAVAVLCVLLALFASVGALAVAAMHNHATPPGKPLAVSTQHASSPTSTPTPNYGGYTALPGTYKGKFTLSSDLIIFTIIIRNQENQGRFSGVFISSQQNGSINGTIDLANDVQWTVFDQLGNASLIFQGGLNGVGQNKNASMGGNLYKCAPSQGRVCLEETGPNNGGAWTVSYASSSLSVFRETEPGWL